MEAEQMVRQLAVRILGWLGDQYEQVTMDQARSDTDSGSLAIATSSRTPAVIPWESQSALKSGRTYRSRMRWQCES
jgi:hypothetical protein